MFRLSLLLLLLLASISFAFSATDPLVLDFQKKIKILEDQKEYDKANKVLSDLASYFFEKKDYPSFIESHLNINENLNNIDQYKKASQHLDQVLKQIGNIKKTELDSIIALTHHSQGINFFFMNAYIKAIPHFKQALVLRQKFLPEHHPDFIKGNQNIGNCYYEQRDYEKAIIFSNQALTENLSSDKPIKARLAYSYEMLAKAHCRKGDLEIGKEYIISALDLLKIIHQDAPWELANVYGDFSGLFELENDAETMIKYASEAIQIYQNISEKYEGDWFGMANAYNNIGVAYEQKGNLEKALNTYKQSLEINQRFEAKRLNYIAKIFNNMSNVYKEKKQYDLALNYVEKAIKINENIDNFTILARNYHNKGNILLKQGAYQAALDFQQKALQQVVYPFEENDVYKNPVFQNVIVTDKVNVLTYLAFKAKAFEQLAKQSEPNRNYKAALQTYETLMELADNIRLDFQSDDSKSFLTSNNKQWIEQAIQVALTLAEIDQKDHYLEKAFAFAERNKAAVLLEAVSRQQAKQQVNSNHPLLQKEQELQWSIAQAEQQIFVLQRQDSIQAVASLREDLLLERQQLQSLRDSLKQAGIYQEKYAKVSSTLLDIRQQFLKNNSTSLIEFFVGEKNIYRFVVQKETLDVVQIPLDFPLKEWIEALRTGIYEAYISNKNISEEERNTLNQQYAIHASKLYKQLFFKNKKAIHFSKKIIIIPDGMLAYIPFDALIKHSIEGDFSNFTAYDFLARQHQISYSYSAELLTYNYQELERSNEQSLLAFVPDYNAGNKQIQANSRAGLLPLKYSQQEAENILEIMKKGQIVTAASKQDFKDFAPNFSMLHFSAHAMVNAENPDYSFIAFSQKTGKLDETELLFINDIYASNLLAKMVVLSACETGIGKIEKGEGVMSLARAFMYAGATSIITSLWRVNDHKTAEMMTRFYEHLNDGYDKDEALFLAKQTFIEEGIDIHPYFWAGFVPIGNMSPIDKNVHWGWYGLIIGVLGLGFGRYFIKKNDSN